MSSSAFDWSAQYVIVTGGAGFLGSHLVERLKAQNVRYAEIMLGSSELPRDSGRLIEDFSAFRDYVTGLEGGQAERLPRA